MPCFADPATETGAIPDGKPKIGLRFEAFFQRVRARQLWALFCVGFFAMGVFPACEPSHETHITVPVDTSGISTDLAVSGLSTKTISVRIRAARSVLESVSDTRPRYAVEPFVTQSGVQTVPVDPDRIPLPKGVEVTGVNPDLITLTVEKRIQKQVPVMMPMTGKLASGYVVAEMTPNPASVRLVGPETAVIPVDKVMTIPVDVSARSESFKKEIALALPEYTQVSEPDEMIVAEIRIEEKMVAKAFEGLPVSGIHADYVFSINPPKLNLVVRGAENVFRTPDWEKGLQIFIDLSGLKPGVYVRRATLTLPVNTFLVEAKPEVFTVKLTPKRQAGTSPKEKSPPQP